MHTIGIDIGGQSTRAALVDADGAIHALRKVATPAGGEPRLLAEAIRSLIVALGIEHTRESALGPPLGGAGSDCVGVALPGRLATDGRTVQRAVNLPRLEGVDVVALLADALNRRVVLRSDVAAAGFAQWRALAARPARFVYLALGTGIGGVAIIDGQIRDAAAGGPAQFGHLIVDTAADAPRCGCGARGCLEALAGGLAIERTGVTDAVIRGLAVGVQQLSHLWAPDVIALGGGVVEHHPDLLARSRDAFQSIRGSLTPVDMELTAAPLASDTAGVIGAALLAMQP